MITQTYSQLMSLSREPLQIINPDEIENPPPFSSISPGHHPSGRILPVFEGRGAGWGLTYFKDQAVLTYVSLSYHQDAPVCYYPDTDITLIVVRGVLILELHLQDQEVKRYSLTEGIGWRIPRGTPYKIIAPQELNYIEFSTNSNDEIVLG